MMLLIERKRLLFLFLLVAALAFTAFPALAQNLESANFTITNDELISGSLEGESDSFNLIGENAPLTGFSESDSFTNAPVILGEARPSPSPTALDSPTPGSPTPGSPTPSLLPSPAPLLARIFRPVTDFIEELLPRQLFDISLEIDEARISDIKDLVARAIFTSFGTEPTAVDLTFTILNQAGEEVYRSNDFITVETEAVFTKKFENISLPLGKYTLVLKTLYNVDVEDQFSQDFEIVKVKKAIPGIWYVIGFPILLLLIIKIWYLIKKKKRSE